MQNSQEVANRIKSYAKSKKIILGKMLSDCDLSKNALSSMQSGGYLPRLENILKLADYLDCSVDYLLGRTDIPEVNKGYSHLSQIEDDSTITPYIAAYGGNAPQKTSFSLETLKQLEDEN